MRIRYLEIVTEDVDAICATYADLHDVTFGEGDDVLGGARTAVLPGGGMIGVRGPLREGEAPVVRPYLLVKDIEGVVEAAERGGAIIAMRPMTLKGHGTFAIYIQGGIEQGFWQD